MEKYKLIDRLHKKAVMYFNISIDSLYEAKYQEIGKAYFSLAEEIIMNQVKASDLREKLSNLEKEAKLLIKKEKPS